MVCQQWLSRVGVLAQRVFVLPIVALSFFVEFLAVEVSVVSYWCVRNVVMFPVAVFRFWCSFYGGSGGIFCVAGRLWVALVVVVVGRDSFNTWRYIKLVCHIAPSGIFRGPFMATVNSVMLACPPMAS